MRVKSYSYKSPSSDRSINPLSAFQYLATKLLRLQMTFTRCFVNDNLAEGKKTISIFSCELIQFTSFRRKQFSENY